MAASSLEREEQLEFGGVRPAKRALSQTAALPRRSPGFLCVETAATGTALNGCSPAVLYLGSS